MQVILTITLSLIVFSIFAQDNFYTKGLPNGYAWTAPQSMSKISFSKSESLSSILLHNKFRTDTQREISFPLDCQNDVDKLLESNSGSTIEMETIEKMIDEFYTNDENLTIPVIGAYCYCIKQLSGNSKDELAVYKLELLEFSKPELKK